MRSQQLICRSSTRTCCTVAHSVPGRPRLCGQRAQQAYDWPGGGLSQWQVASKGPTTSSDGVSQDVAALSALVVGREREGLPE